jgi:P27 family predicted phage terminase small subunit
MKGRRPVPTPLKLVAGTQRKHRANPGEPLPIGDLYAPPEALTEAQREEWRYAVDNAPRGLLRLLDRSIFSQWCIASVDLAVAELALRTEGMVVNRADGTGKMLNPWVRARRDAFDRFMKATSELGFSPTSRSRITLAGGGKKETNRFANNAAHKRA